MLTEDFLKDLYLNPNHYFKNPKLQLLNYEISETNTNEIMYYLSIIIYQKIEYVYQMVRVL